MTTTEPQAAPVEGNGATPTVDPDGVQYLPDGTARFTIRGGVYVLHGPTVGQFKRLHAHWVGLGGRPTSEQVEGQLVWVRWLFNGDPNADPPFAGLSDRHLDENSDEWPAWLGMASYQLDLMTHFRDVPLARGGPVKATQ